MIKRTLGAIREIPVPLFFSDLFPFDTLCLNQIRPSGCSALTCMVFSLHMSWTVRETESCSISSFKILQLKRLCPNDPDASKKLKECEKAVQKIRFEEAIAVQESERCSVADTIDYKCIGNSLVYYYYGK
jgi:PPP5 TPR repeat region